MSDTCMIVDGITRHVFWPWNTRVCKCGGKTVVLDEEGRVVDEAVTMTPSELDALAEALARPPRRRLGVITQMSESGRSC